MTVFQSLPNNFKHLVICSLLFAVPVLWRCGSSAPNSGASAPVVENGGFTNQATGPVDRPPIVAETGPQGDCRPYYVEGDGFEPEKVPEVCRQSYERWWDYSHAVIIPRENEVRMPLPPPVAVRIIDQELILAPQLQLHHDFRDFPQDNDLFLQEFK